MVNAEDRSSSTVAVGRGMEPRGDGMKTVVVLIGSLMMLIAVVGGIVWTSAERKVAVDSPPVRTAAPVVTVETAAAVAPAPAAFHDDIYFDFKSARLRADAVTVLQKHAGLLTQDSGWMVVVQGYADRNGPPVYNRTLAERRVESVKKFLVELGVPDTSIRVVTIGQDAFLCDDPGPECQRLNRRVHLEMRRLALPTAATPVAAPAETAVER
jgi:peptidoglycan-associated lipoprotein